MLKQAGVLGSQPSVPVIALTGDGAVWALPKRIASQEMIWLEMIWLGDQIVEQDFAAMSALGSEADLSNVHRDVR